MHCKRCLELEERIIQLLDANTAEVERRRVAERWRAILAKIIADHVAAGCKEIACSPGGEVI